MKFYFFYTLLHYYSFKRMLCSFYLIGNKAIENYLALFFQLHSVVLSQPNLVALLSNLFLSLQNILMNLILSF